MVPITPIGSRTKILISSQVNLSSAIMRTVNLHSQIPTGEKWSWQELGVGTLGIGIDIVYSRMECPVSVRNTSSRFGSSVLKLVTWMRCSARH